MQLSLPKRILDATTRPNPLAARAVTDCVELDKRWGFLNLPSTVISQLVVPPRRLAPPKLSRSLLSAPPTL